MRPFVLFLMLCCTTCVTPVVAPAEVHNIESEVPKAVFHMQDPKHGSPWACIVDLERRVMDCLPFKTVYDGLQKQQSKLQRIDIRY